MARSRNIKPGFFTNDQLAGLPPLTRLLFVALWTLADREGRISDRPKKIKASALPYDDGDADGMLRALHDAGFIERYQVGDIKCIRIVNWSKHQNPHVKEAASSLPAPDKHQTSPVQEPGKTQPLPERAGLIPSLLIPDSLKETVAIATSSPAEPTTAPPDRSAHLMPAALPACPHRQLIALFAEKLPELPRPKAELWDGKNAEAMRARWKWVLTATRESGERYANNEAEALAWFAKFFDRVAASDFLAGRTDKWRGCNLAWLLKHENFTKVVEGNYLNRATA